MTRIIQGRRYLMRDQREVPAIIALWRDFLRKYPTSDLNIHQWMIQRGKVYKEVK